MKKKTLSPMDKTRAKKRGEGLVPVECWVYDGLQAELKQFKEKINARHRRKKKQPM